MTTPRPRTPPGLGPSGRALWRKLTTEYEFGPAEVPVLEAACRQVDALAALEAVVETEGVLTTGSKDQTVVHPAVTEARLGRLTVARLLAELAIPDESGRPETAASRRARKAVRSRWDRKRTEQERREMRAGLRPVAGD